MNTFTSGAFRTALSGARPTRGREGLHPESRLTRCMTASSASERSPQAAEGPAQNTVADGWPCGDRREALAAKLVDQIGYIEDARALARELGKAPGAAVVRYKQEHKLRCPLVWREAALSSGKPAAKIELNLKPAVPRCRACGPVCLITFPPPTPAGVCACRKPRTLPCCKTSPALPGWRCFSVCWVTNGCA